MMGLTGFMLWNPIITARILPGEFIPAAKVAHGLEAVLAVLAILLWHFYGVHLKTWNWSMIKGTLTKHQMLEEHAKEVEEIANGEVGTAQLSRGTEEAHAHLCAVCRGFDGDFPLPGLPVCLG